MNKIYPTGSKKITVNDKIAIFTEGSCDVFYLIGTPEAGFFVYQQTITASEVVLTPGATSSTVKIQAASGSEVYYETGTAPVVSRKTVSEVSSPANAGESIQSISIVANEIADAGTITAAQLRGQVLSQDASGGAVTCTTPTGMLIAEQFPELEVGNAIPIYHNSNHATNTSTIAGDTGVTLVGSGAVTSTGGQFLLIKTAAATFDLVRVG